MSSWYPFQSLMKISAWPEKQQRRDTKWELSQISQVEVSLFTATNAKTEKQKKECPLAVRRRGLGRSKAAGLSIRSNKNLISTSSVRFGSTRTVFENNSDDAQLIRLYVSWLFPYLYPT